MNKVIQIFPHSLGQSSVIYEGGWHAKLARDILKVTSKYKMECWRIEKGVKKVQILEREGITYKIFPSFGILGKEWSYLLLRDLKKEVKSGKVLVHVHGLFFSTTYAICLLFKNIPILVKDHSNWSYLEGAGQALRTRNFVKFGGNLILYILTYYPQRLGLGNIYRILVPANQRKIYLSKFIKACKIEVQPNGVDFETFRPMEKDKVRSDLGLDPEKKYILYVGAMVRVKGLDYLLHSLPKVFNEFPQAELLLIGDGYLRSNLESLCLKLKIKDKVKFLGVIPNKKLPLWYNAADVFVLPSWNESFSVVAVEALACGTPFIGTSVGAIPEIIEHFKAGYLVPPRNSDVLTKNILQCLSKVTSFILNREDGRKYFDCKIVAESTIKLYDEAFFKYYG